MTSRITWDEASARRYERQLLRTPSPSGTPVAEVVGALLAAHAQVLSAAELSVGLRLDGATRQDVRAALWEDRSVVKTYGPRGTVHLLASAELPFWSAALTAIPVGPSPFPPDVRMTPGQEDEVVAAIGDALDGKQLTIDELNEEVVARTGPWAGDLVMEAFQGKWPRWRQVMHRAGQSGALCFAPNRGRKATYTRPPRFEALPAEEALATLVRHYLYAYGPATPQHFAKWVDGPKSWAADLFASLAARSGIEEVDFEGVPAWVVAGDTGFPSEGVRGVRLLPYFDAYAIAAQPRERMFPGAAYQRALAGGQAGNYPVLLVDGVVAGVWHQRRQGKRTTVTVEPLDPMGRLGRLSGARERELREQVERVGEILEAAPELVVGKVTVGAHA
ncbi:winged helix DNA-binding domain-containing protein [Streptomyces sp. HC44]|uniref:Winged helix DNA-binding domain-containing protein n=1 Tax=Streptomyces scabichelini TaxID=2711217 RepID=A0A6G4V723_9ACTN|nr:winged helix DNA-binding domain-containing protein [Streptomyces scabichelini]NGO09859.1 winged helix DNA-binding domain-containing protein [Streptomyces scabichelini]